MTENDDINFKYFSRPHSETINNITPPVMRLILLSINILAKTQNVSIGKTQVDRDPRSDFNQKLKQLNGFDTRVYDVCEHTYQSNVGLQRVQYGRYNIVHT